MDAALAAYDRALILNPSLAEAWLGRANGLANARRFEEALAAYDKTLALKSELADAWFGRGNVLFECKRFDVALVAYDRALALRPDFAEAWLGRGIGCFLLGRYADALFVLDKALAVKPEIDYATSLRFHLKQQICDWSNFDAEAAELLAKVRLGTTLSYPIRHHCRAILGGGSACVRARLLRRAFSIRSAWAQRDLQPRSGPRCLSVR